MRGTVGRAQVVGRLRVAELMSLDGAYYSSLREEIGLYRRLVPIGLYRLAVSLFLLYVLVTGSECKSLHYFLNMSSASGVFIPLPHRGSAPEPHCQPLGTSVPWTPNLFTP